MHTATYDALELAQYPEDRCAASFSTAAQYQWIFDNENYFNVHVHAGSNLRGAMCNLYNKAN